MDSFEAHRSWMFAIAYRMLGSVMEAEDIVQDAYLRYQAVAPDSIVTPRAYLTTMVTRLCINALHSARAQRETYIGPWLPEPLSGDSDLPSPAQQASIHESISMAFLVLLETLMPVERAVFLLREVFDYEYAEIAAIVGKEEAACRQSFSRAKKHVAAHRPRFKSSPDEHRRMLERFMRAIGDGDLDGLVQLLADNVTMWADGGGQARGAATRPLHGPATVAQFVLGSVRFMPENIGIDIQTVNGEPAIVLRDGAQAFVVIFVKAHGDHITDVWAIGNPDKLRDV